MKTSVLAAMAYEEALKVLDRCATPNGIYASGTMAGYTSVWARDSMISLMGASLTGKFQEQFRFSIETLSKYQHPLGQIANAVDMFDKSRKPEVTFATIDSTLWYIVGQYIYAKRYEDNSLLKKYKNNIDQAFLWLRYQDTGNDGLLDQLPTTDWQDAFPHKYGHCINTQALYYGALSLSGKTEEALILKEKANKSLFDTQKGYYLPYRWKNHQEFQEKGNWFDSLGNMLAIFFGLADKRHANKIFRHVAVEEVNRPYPMKTIWPPIEPGDPDWKDYYWADNAGKPNYYLNGCVWPFNGGFYVTNLGLFGNKKEAKQELEFLAQGNRLGTDNEWEFHEWIDLDGKPKGQQYQAWSAGTYVMAYHAVVKGEKVL